MEDPWHNWHNPEETSEMEDAAAQWQGQQHLQSALVSVFRAKPHQTDLMLLEAPSRMGPWYPLRGEIKYWNTQITGGVVVIAMVVEA